MARNVMCKKSNNLVNGWCEKKIDSPDPGIVRDCQYFWEKTNADRIRAMSDEELAEYLVYHNPYSTEKNCLRWLKQPAEGELL